MSYSAPRNADGHSDRAASLALMISAAGKRVNDFKPVAFARPDYESLEVC